MAGVIDKTMGGAHCRWAEQLTREGGMGTVGVLQLRRSFTETQTEAKAETETHQEMPIVRRIDRQTVNELLDRVSTQSPGCSGGPLDLVNAYSSYILTTN